MGAAIALLAEPTGVIALCGVALGLGVMAWRARHPTPAARDQIRLVSTRFLGGKKFVALLEVEGERLLLGVTDDSVRLLARLRRAGRDGARSAPPGAFREARAGRPAAPAEAGPVVLAERRG